MQNDKATPSNQKVCDLILKQIEKPENYIFCRAINVYDNRYRVNIYSKTTNHESEGVRISNSYFVKYDGKEIIL